MDDAAQLAPPVVSQTHGDAYHWILHAEIDPQLPARVLGHFTVRNELPWFFCMRQVSEDRVEIEVRSGSESEAAAHRLALRLRSIPTVIEVTWSVIADGELLLSHGTRPVLSPP